MSAIMLKMRAKAPGRAGAISPLLALFAAAVLLPAGCAPGQARAAEDDTGSTDGSEVTRAPVAARPVTDSVPAEAGETDHAHHNAPAAGPASEHSIYHAGGEWLDRFGETLSLSELQGRVQLVALVYTSCSFACPRIVAIMKRIEGELGEGYHDRVGYTLVSIDPERDKPERLRSFAEASRLDADRWTMLNGSNDDLLTLSVLLGVKYRATGDGEFAHSNVITVLDPSGKLVHRIEGLNAPVEPAIEAIRRAAP